MRKLSKYIILTVPFLIIFFVLIGYSVNNKPSPKDAFGIEQFANEMKAKNYNFKLQDVREDFLPTTRKRMLIDKEALDIYVYKSNRNMEKDAGRIDGGGCGYSNGLKSVQVSWVSFPHFYKKGTIIVQYVGKNEKIISDLKDILGEQFAGYSKTSYILPNK